MSKPYKVGYIPGSFDLFHIGHLNLFRRAKERCERLIVGVVNDELSRQLKGKRPYIPFDERLAIVRACGCVDEAIEVNQANTDKVAAWYQLHYDCHFAGDDHLADLDSLRNRLRPFGATAECFPYTRSTSSTQIQQLIARSLGDDRPLVSFDVFDTLIARDTATPDGIFAVMQSRLRHTRKCSPRLRDSFYRLRLDAEATAYQFSRARGQSQPSLEGIYAFMRLAGAFADGLERDDLIALERATELRHIRPVAANIAKLKSILASGRRVVLISDMYLDSPTIRLLLRKADPVLATLPLYVSNECGGSKRLGDLYRFVREREHVEFANWTHFGDNPVSDVETPRRLRINAVHLPFEPLKPWERQLVDADPGDAYTQLAVGAARRARLEAAASQRQKWFDVGSSIGGMMLAPYVRWVLDESLRRGIRHLYFVARDGFILKQIADAIISAEHLALATSYLYGSRQAWQLPCCTLPDSEPRDFSGYTRVSETHNLAQFAAAFGLAVDDLLPFLPERYRDASGSLHENAVPLAKELSESPAFRAKVRDKNRPQLDLALAYLRQEINFDEPFAFVEIQGTGMTQRCLARLCRRLSPRRAAAFFLRYAPYEQQPGDLFDLLTFGLNNTAIIVPIEAFCRATHGQTLGYERSGGKIAPVLNAEGDALRSYGYDGYLAGVLAYADAQRAVFAKAPWLKRAGLETVWRCWRHLAAPPPGDEVLDFWGGVPHCLTVDGVLVRAAPKLTESQVRAHYLDGKSPEDVGYTGIYWEQSLLRSGPEIVRLAAERAQAQERRREAELAKPYGRFRQHTIALYGAGVYGRRVHDFLLSFADVTIAAWADKRHEACRAEGLDVVPPEALRTVHWDYVVIAVRAVELADEIRAELAALGLPNDKIVWGAKPSL